jgi:glucosyl-3-phosphoglycerate synthase
MADFFQHAQLPTLQQLAVADSSHQDAELLKWSANRPILLLLPALKAEFDRPALPRMLDAIASIPWVSEVLLTVNGMDDSSFDRALAMAKAKLQGKPVRMIWNDGPRMKEVHAHLKAGGWNGYEAGKGTNIWTGLAYLTARQFQGIVVSHDTDILNYGAELPRKLAYPLAHPEMPYVFAKGYYSRVAGRLFGRLTRLLVFPLIQAMIQVLGPKPLLSHLESFRYPLSGEFAADMSSLEHFRLPSSWGLEIAMLCEAHRHLPPAHQCQVDMGFHYEHRHRAMVSNGEGLPEAGLVEVAEDVAACLFDQVFREAEDKAADALIRLVIERYRTCSMEWLDRYEHVALINGLEFDRGEETSALTHFEAALRVIWAQEEVDAAARQAREFRPAPSTMFERDPGLREAFLAAAVE